MIQQICMFIFALTPLNAAPPHDELLSVALDSSEVTWRKIETNNSRLTSREIFLHALLLCETNKHLERLSVLFEHAGRMQDRDPRSPSFGNFLWYRDEGKVGDYNAVEFSMQSACIIWLNHQSKLNGKTRELFTKILNLAVQGCLSHRPPASYTNIALMNAQNLLLLGQGLKRPDIENEGAERLDTVCRYTWEFGTHEYNSPTYYGVNLDCLGLIEAFSTHQTAVKQARALLELFWTDIAANWFTPTARLAGSQSRTYSFLSGRGALDKTLFKHGLLSQTSRAPSLVYDLLNKWTPNDDILAISSIYPREVRQSWGFSNVHARTHYLLNNITLGTSSANYGAMDMPLTVDFAGCDVRGYFVPDGRRDPYGKKRIAAGAHEKTLHLKPFWTAAQRKEDALGLVLYRPGDIPAETTTLESHFVFPRTVDAIRIGGKEVTLTSPGLLELQNGESLVLRKGDAVLGIKVVWHSGMAGHSKVALVEDANKHGALRLTVAHHSYWGIEKATEIPGAAFWCRIGNDITTTGSFTKWISDFDRAAATVKVTEEKKLIQVAGRHGPLVIETVSPFYGVQTLDPPPSSAVLEINGKDRGREILSPLGIRVPQVDDVTTITKLSKSEGVLIEAEKAALKAPMIKGVENDNGITYIWMPGRPGVSGGNATASATWRLNAPDSRKYYLWGRVKTPTPSDDSFWVRSYSKQSDILPLFDWHTGTHKEWEWIPVSNRPGTEHIPITLPEGDSYLQIRVREDGAKLDQLFISPINTLLPK